MATRDYGFDYFTDLPTLDGGTIGDSPKKLNPYTRITHVPTERELAVDRAILAVRRQMRD